MNVKCLGCLENMKVKHINVFRMSKKFWFVCPNCCYGNLIFKKDFPKNFDLKTTCKLFPIKNVTKMYTFQNVITNQKN